MAVTTTGHGLDGAGTAIQYTSSMTQAEWPVTHVDGLLPVHQHLIAAHGGLVSDVVQEPVVIPAGSRFALTRGHVELHVGLQGMTTAISVTGLVKSFGRTLVLDGLNLEVATGEVHGFLGPNGAGKTTTLRILLGLMRKDAGKARLLDGDPWRDAVTLHRRLAYVPGDVNLWPNLSGGEVIDLLGRLRGGLDPRRRAEFLDRFELDPTKKGRAYSKGNRQKVALIAALASDLRQLTRTAITAELAAAPPGGLSDLPGVHDLQVDGSRVHCQVDTASLSDLLARLTQVGVRTLTSRQPTLEDLFLRQYGEQQADEPGSAAG